jgi:putative hydrolase of the HAD superfamily
MGVAPQDAVYVGDDLRLDVQGARGRPARRLDEPPRQHAHLAAGVTPDAICATFDELLAWIRGQMQDSRA